ncbi:MAG: nucleotide exchange factor GrpE [Candidatus Saccharimonadales bacterium]
MNKPANKASASKKAHPDLAKQVVDLTKRLEEVTLALQHERADAINIRRRHDEDIKSMRARLKVDVVSQLLPVVDNFERALKHVPTDLAENDYIKGVQSIVKQFEQTLVGMGVEKIKTVDQAFDPNLHEAVSMEEGSGDKEIITEELQAGYRLGDSVIRHAMVRVKQV